MKSILIKMLTWFTLSIVLRMSMTADDKDFKTVVLEKKSTVYKLNDFGIPVGGRKSLSMRIKSCQGIVLALKKTYPDKDTRYLSIWISVKGVTKVFDCVNLPAETCNTKPIKYLEKELWKCPADSDLWVKWSLSGYLALGSGLSPGQNKLLEYQGPKTETPVNYIGIVALYEKNTVIKVALVEKIDLDPPAAHISIEETTTVGAKLYSISGQKNSYTYSIIDPKEVTFELKTNDVHLKSALDYEKKTSHVLLVLVRDGMASANFTLFVDVINVFDELPVIGLSKNLAIPEEMPVDSTVGQLFFISDPDPGDKHTCKLTGSNLLTIDPNTCTVKIKARIDRDGAKGVKSLQLKLSVTDLGDKTKDATLTVKIVDINDNPPLFMKKLYTFSVMSKPKDKTIGTITAQDPDREGKKKFDVELTIKEGNKKGVFTLAHNELMADINKLMDRGNLQDEKGSYSLLIEAKDKPVSGTPLVASTVAVVKVSSIEDLVIAGKKKANSAVTNKYAPKWTGVIPAGKRFKMIRVLENTTVGTVIFTAQANDQDSGLAGKVVYGFVPVPPKKGKPPTNATMYLKMDALTGQLRVAMPLNCDKKSGGVTYFKITIYANDSAIKPNFIKAGLKILLKNVNDNPPMFNQSIYYASFTCNHLHKNAILNFTYTDYDKNSLKLPQLTGTGHENYMIYKSRYKHKSLKIGSKVKIDESVDHTHVITMTLSDGKYNASALVIIHFKSCAAKPSTVKPSTPALTPAAVTSATVPETTAVKITTETTSVATTTTALQTTTTEFISTKGETFVTLCTTFKKEPTTELTTTTSTTTTSTTPTTVTTSTTTPTSTPSTTTITTTTTTTTTTTRPTTPRRTLAPSTVPCCSCNELERVKNLYNDKLAEGDDDIPQENGATGWAIKATCIVLAACLLCTAVFCIAKKYGFGKSQRQKDNKPPETNSRPPPGQGPKKPDDHNDLEANRGKNLRNTGQKGAIPDVLPATNKPHPPKPNAQSAQNEDETKRSETAKQKDDSMKTEIPAKKNDENIRRNSKGSGCGATQPPKNKTKTLPEEHDGKGNEPKGGKSNKAEMDTAKKENSLAKIKEGEPSPSVEATVLGIFGQNDKKKKKEPVSNEKAIKTSEEDKKGSNTETEVKKTSKAPASSKRSELMDIVQLKVEKDVGSEQKGKGAADSSKSADKVELEKINSKDKSSHSTDGTESITLTATSTNVTSSDGKEEEPSESKETKKSKKALTKSKSKALAKAKAIGKMSKKRSGDNGEQKNKEGGSSIEDLPTPTKKTIPELPDSIKKRCSEIPDEPEKSPIPDLPDSAKNKPQWENPKTDPMKNRMPDFPDEVPSRPQWVAPSLPDKPKAKGKAGSLNPDLLPASNRPAWNDPKMDPMKDMADALAMKTMALIQQTSKDRPVSTYSESAEAYTKGAKERRDSNTSTTKSLPPLALSDHDGVKAKKSKRQAAR